MREIKFRVWDGTDILDFPDVREWDIEDYNNFTHQNGNVQEVMQFTGLKDKNGKEIYEGDVIGFDDGVVPGKQTGFCRLEVKFGKYDCGCGDYYCNESGFGFYLAGYDGYHREDGATDKYEYDRRMQAYPVIGNIYENPELLK